MATFTPPDPDYESRTREDFAEQRLMKLLGARIKTVQPGFCELELPFRDELSQQLGFFHAGATAAIADAAGGCAAFTLMAKGANVLTVEMKINFVAKAVGELIVAKAHVKSAGKRIFVCGIDVHCIDRGVATLCATALQTAYSTRS